MERNLVLSAREFPRRNATVAVIGCLIAMIAITTLNASAATVSFKPAQVYPVSAGPTSVAVGDFNGDGNPDLVSADYGANGVSMLLGNGDGTFQAAKSFSAGSGGLPSTSQLQTSTEMANRMWR